MDILTYGLSMEQEMDVRNIYPDADISDVTDQYQDLIAVSCDAMVINTDCMSKVAVDSISEYRYEIQADKEGKYGQIPCYLFSEHPKAIYGSVLWAEHALLKRWKASRCFDAFIWDGIVDLPTYVQQDKKILFVLRDMNCKEDDRNLARDLADHGSGWKTWNNVGRWVVALLDGAEEYPRDMQSRKRAIQMRRVAAMNLKKEGGSSRASKSELIGAVGKDREYILSQIKMYQPDLIVCCGFTSTLIGNATLLYGDQEKGIAGVFGDDETGGYGWESFESGHFQNHKWWYYYVNISGKKVPVISYCHPQTTNMCGKRGHDDLFEPLYRDMLLVRKKFLESGIDC